MNLAGLSRVKPKATAILLTAGSLLDENSFDHPQKIAPVESEVEIPGAKFTRAFPANSLTVLRVGTRN